MWRSFGKKNKTNKSDSLSPTHGAASSESVDKLHSDSQQEGRVASGTAGDSAVKGLSVHLGLTQCVYVFVRVCVCAGVTHLVASKHFLLPLNSQLKRREFFPNLVERTSSILLSPRLLLLQLTHVDATSRYPETFHSPVCNFSQNLLPDGSQKPGDTFFHFSPQTSHPPPPTTDSPPPPG